jgi:general stress protein 26
VPDVENFADIETEFSERVRRVVWCNVATVDAQGRPRSRIMHPIWEGTTGWIATHRTSFKDRHLTANPYVSLAYIEDTAHPVYADCVAAWAVDPTDKERVWDLFASAPAPLGYDPTPFFVAPDHPNFGVLKLTPWRIAVVTQSLSLTLFWRNEPGAAKR